MNPYIIGGVALVIAILGWQLKASVARNGELEVKLATQVSETLECADANTTTMATISELTDEILVMVEERRVDAVRREQVLDERDEELTRMRVAADRLRRERRDEVDDNPDCAELSALSVQRFCPTTAGQLRKRSRSSGGNEDENSREAGRGF